MESNERVIGYVRVSTDDQGLNGAGLEAQRGIIQAECARRGWELARVEEDVLSGKTMKRPGLQEALDACRSGEVGGIVVAKLDRLSRSIVDFGHLLEEASKKGFNVVALDLGLDLSTPHGEFVGHLVAATAQWERKIIGARTKEALGIKRAQGVRLGRPPTLAAKVIRRIQRERARGKSFAAIAGSLNAAGVPTAQGGQRWYPATVRNVAMRGQPSARGPLSRSSK